MDEVTFEVEAVTPIFIAGADQTNIENEGLRAPSLKGLLRWWFRAALGGAKFSYKIQGIKQLVKEIKHEENEIWGGAFNERCIKSKIVVKTVPIRTFSTRMLKDYIRGKGRGTEGIEYLSYGLSGRTCIATESTFKLNIHFRKISNEDRKKVIATVWLLLNLGGIGSKNRKGFGSLRAGREVAVDGIEFRNPRDVKELEEYLKLGTEECLSSFGWRGPARNSSFLPEFSIIAPNFWAMKILDNIYSSPINAINDIGRKIREYRENPGKSALHTHYAKGKQITYRVTKDYDSIKSIYTGKPSSVPQGSIFGLPHQFQFQSLGRKGRKALVTGVKHERRISPLHIKVWKLDGNKYVLGVQLFQSRFLEEDKLLISDIDNRSIKTEVLLPSYTYLKNFLNKLSGRWIKL